MKDILITGAHGFIGRNAALLFSESGWCVTGMDLAPWAMDEWSHWGITNYYTCHVNVDNLQRFGGKPKVILNCAGTGAVGFSMIHPYQDYQANVDTTISVLEFVRLYIPEAGIIYPSSAAVYGSADHIPIDEDEELRPITPYGVHKKIAEDLCRCYAQHFDLHVAIVRYFSVYGVGLRKQLLWDACSKIIDNNYSFWGSGTEVRDWVHIKDAVRLLVNIAEQVSPQCPILNCGSGMGVENRDILLELFNCFGKSDTPLFSGTGRPGDPVQYIANITRAMSYGWEPEWHWKRGIKEYVDWFRNGTA